MHGKSKSQHLDKLKFCLKDSIEKTTKEDIYRIHDLMLWLQALIEKMNG